jgi:hypothetical protein
MCEDCIIRENRLEENGKNQPEPVCGVFVLIAEKIDVINNRIINNGPDLINVRNQSAGPRGGIVILFAFGYRSLRRWEEQQMCPRSC